MASTNWAFVLLVLAVVAAGTIWLRLRRRRSRALEAFSDLRRRADVIAAEFPDEVQAWGGKKVLFNVEVVREIIATMENDVSF